MKSTLKLICLILSLVMMLSLFACAVKDDKLPDDGDGEGNNDNENNGNDAGGDDNKADPVHINVAVLKGPTGVGTVKLASDSDKKLTQGDYTVSFYETTEVSNIIANVVNGSVDIAAVPINAAAMLNAKTNGGVQVICANALGVLSIVGKTDAEEITDLKGMTINVVGQASTPEYIIKYVLTQNGVNPETDVNLVYYTDANAAVAAIGDGIVAMIPEPALSVNLAKDAELEVLFNMTDEWNKVCETKLIQGCLVVRSAFAEANPEAVSLFLTEYAASVDYVNNNISEAAALLVEYSIIANQTVAAAAIPNCNVVCITGSEMKSSVSAMLTVLYNASPSSVGGALPADSFYYGN